MADNPSLIITGVNPMNVTPLERVDRVTGKVVGINWEEVWKIIMYIDLKSTVPQTCYEFITVRIKPITDSADDCLAMNALTLLHTASFTVELETRKVFSSKKEWLNPLMEAAKKHKSDAVKEAALQVLSDWAHAFGDESLGKNSRRMKPKKYSLDWRPPSSMADRRVKFRQAGNSEADWKAQAGEDFAKWLTPGFFQPLSGVGGQYSYPEDDAATPRSDYSGFDGYSPRLSPRASLAREGTLPLTEEILHTALSARRSRSNLSSNIESWLKTPSEVPSKKSIVSQTSTNPPKASNIPTEPSPIAGIESIFANLMNQGEADIQWEDPNELLKLKQSGQMPDDSFQQSMAQATQSIDQHDSLVLGFTSGFVTDAGRSRDDVSNERDEFSISRDQLNNGRDEFSISRDQLNNGSHEFSNSREHLSNGRDLKELSISGAMETSPSPAFGSKAAPSAKPGTVSKKQRSIVLCWQMAAWAAMLRDKKKKLAKQREADNQGFEQKMMEVIAQSNADRRKNQQIKRDAARALSKYTADIQKLQEQLQKTEDTLNAQREKQATAEDDLEDLLLDEEIVDEAIQKIRSRLERADRGEFTPDNSPRTSNNFSDM